MRLRAIQGKLDKSWYENLQTKGEREMFGLALRGDEIDAHETEMKSLEEMLGNVIPFPKLKAAR
jgi:hypothetical protein